MTDLNDIPMIINSCDKYQNLWKFCIDRIRLHSIFNKLIINNEIQEMDLHVNFASQFRGQKIYPLKKWSIQLRDLLNNINSDYIILSQDDYFINYSSITFSKLKNHIFNMNYYSFDCLHLSKYVNIENRHTQKFVNNYIPLKRDKYYFNTQIAIWNRQSLIKTLFCPMNPWQWECFSHKIIKNLKIVRSDQIEIDYFAVLKNGKLSEGYTQKLSEIEKKYLVKYYGTYKRNSWEKFRTLQKILIP